MPSPSSPPAPLPTRAQLARLEADLAAAQLRRERLAFELDIGDHPDPAALEVKLLRAVAAVAELEAQRDALAAPAAALPPAPAANDTTPGALAAATFLTTAEAAALLGVSVKTLEALRAREQGPPFKKVGRRVRYERALLIEWSRQR
jgi:excisionase family DNA binding protein